MNATDGITDMNQLLRRPPPADAATEPAPESDPEAPPSFDGGARVPPATGTNMNALLRRQLHGRA